MIRWNFLHFLNYDAPEQAFPQQRQLATAVPYLPRNGGFPFIESESEAVPHPEDLALADLFAELLQPLNRNA